MTSPLSRSRSGSSSRFSKKIPSSADTVTARLTLACLLTALAASSSWAQAAAPVDLTTLVHNLGSLDYPVRTNAARQLRRAAAADAVPALARAARAQDEDEYVRYRALVLLTSFGDRPTTEV